MRLISLTANQESFHPIEFRRSGTTLIVGAQKDASAKNTERTYNGVGKSLLIALLHFCLGAKKNDEFEAKLPDWQFILRFEHKGKEYRVSRKTGEQNKINLNDDEMTATVFRSTMERLVFSLPTPVPSLTFRSLISSFVRPRKDSYIAFDQVDAKATPYHRLLRTSFLLGLDTGLVIKKFDLRAEQERIRELRTNLSKDTIFVEFFTGNRNSEIELLDLERKIERLKVNLDNFKIAEDYHDRQRDADLATRRLQGLRNEQVAIRNAIENINQSLEVSPDITPEMITQIFEEANAALPERITKKVEEVAAFHNRLLTNRVKRLTSEKAALERDLSANEKSVLATNEEVDDLRRFLGTHGALDEFVAMSESLSSYQAKAQKLKDYRELLDQYSNRIQELTADLSNETIRATKYLKDARLALDSNLDRFRSFSSRFYGDRPGGLTVANNEGENQTRFDINARIEDDAADGINEVKIFCFDMTVLAQRHNHSIEFLVHDSRLFSDIDIRQRATIFKIANEVGAAENFQYIATLNEDQISAMKGQFSPAEFKQCIEDAIVLRLTDDSPQAKLLGIQVDMQYERRT